MVRFGRVARQLEVFEMKIDIGIYLPQAKAQGQKY